MDCFEKNNVDFQKNLLSILPKCLKVTKIGDVKSLYKSIFDA